MKKVKLMLGDNMESLKKLPDNSVDSIVSDPPYGLSFMGKKWDYDVPSVEFWKEVFRVLKPGGHILSFGGTRTYHRMVVNIEDAGFEIRDQVMWLYGSGFPKSHNIGKAIDKLNGVEIEKGDKFNVVGGTDVSNGGSKFRSDNPEYVKYEAQNEYEGWGTALKPANEPICVARKPLSEKTIAENVIKWGTGGINIDGCRVATDDKLSIHIGKFGFTEGTGSFTKDNFISNGQELGRFPANIILDETAAELLDLQSGISKPSKERFSTPGGHTFGGSITEHNKNGIGRWPGDNGGGASRFFYVAKVSKKERNLGLDGFEDKKESMFADSSGRKQLGRATLPGNEHQDKDLQPQKNTHPTLKPINLMTYLCRLVTPEGGIVLDPFMGSGSTGISALLEGFRFIGMEQDKSYFDIASARIEAYEDYRKLLK